MGGELSEFVYRRLPPGHQKTNQARDIAFQLRKKDLAEEEPSLSLYEPSQKTPRDVLQQMLDQQMHLEQSEDPEISRRATAFLKSNGRTVEEVVKTGWRVAKVSKAAFTDGGFRIGEPDATGHYAVKAPADGAPEQAFKDHSSRIAGLATVLSVDECQKTLTLQTPEVNEPDEGKRAQ